MYLNARKLAFVLLCVLCFTHSFADDLAEDKSQFGKWLSKQNIGQGRSLNLPNKKNESFANEAEIEIKKIVERLIPGFLASNNVMINIVSTPKESAFVREVDLSAMKPELSSALRNLFQWKHNKNAVEITFSLGMLRFVKTKDELAFVVAHELNHYLEDHTESIESIKEMSDEEKKKRAKDLQRFEVLADYKAFDLLAGKYNLNDSIQVMKRMFAIGYEENKDSKWDARDAGFSFGSKFLQTHHSHGVRIALILARIESLKRENIATHSNVSQPWLVNIPPYRPPLSHVDNTEEEYRRAEGYVQMILDEMILVKAKVPMDSNLQLIAHEHFGAKISEALSLSKNSVRNLLEISVKKIQDSKTLSTKQEKFDAIIELVSIFKGTIDRVSNRDIVAAKNAGKDRTDTKFFSRQQVRRELLGIPLRGILSLGKFDYCGECSFKKYRLNSDLASNVGNSDTFTNQMMNFFNHSLFVEFLGRLMPMGPGKEFLDAWIETVRELKSGKGVEYLLELLSTSRSLGDRVRKEKNYYIKKNLSRVFESLIVKIENEFSTNWNTYLSHFIENIKTGETPAHVWGNIKFYRSDAKDPRVLKIYGKMYSDFSVEMNKYIVSILPSLYKHDPKTIEFFVNSDKGLKVLGFESHFRNYLNSHSDKVFNHYRTQESLSEKYSEVENMSRLILGGFIPSKDNSKKERMKLMESLLTWSGKSYNLDFRYKLNRHDLRNFSASIIYDFTNSDIEYLFDRAIPQLESELTDSKFLEKKEALIAYIIAAKSEMEKGKSGGISSGLMFPMELAKHNRKLGEDLMKMNVALTSRYSFAVASRIGILHNLLAYTPKTIQFDIDFVRNLMAKVANLRKIYQRQTTEINRRIHGKKFNFKINEPGFAAGESYLDHFFIKHTKEAIQNEKNLHKIISTLDFFFKLWPNSLEHNTGYRNFFENFIISKLNSQNIDYSYQLLVKRKISPVLSTRVGLPILNKYLENRMNESSDFKDLKTEFDRIAEETDLARWNGELFSKFKVDVASTYKVQPDEIERLFPEEKVIINTENTKGMGVAVRLVSGVEGAFEDLEILNKIELVEYLMGRRGDKLPVFLESSIGKDFEVIREATINLKTKLSLSNDMERGLFIAMLFSGDKQLLEKDYNLERLIDYLFKGSSFDGEGKVFAKAILKAQGENMPLAVGAIFGKKSQNGESKLSEGEILRSGFEAFGAAGIKFGQYLGFTSEFEWLGPHLSKLQDGALPLDFLSVSRLLYKHFDGQWYKDWKIEKVLGSGSVNVAVMLKHRENHKLEVLSFTRDQIEVGIRNDFNKLRTIAVELYKIDSHLPDHKNRFGFMEGLVNWLEQGVLLELNKENAVYQQEKALRLYSQKIGGWTLQSVKPTDYHPELYMRMGLAKGETARKLRENDFKTYKDAMSKVLYAELDHLLKSKVKSGLHFANPDLHDGQVLIDKKTKNISIIDFGQATDMTTITRSIGLKLFKILVSNSLDEIRSVSEQIINEIGAQEMITDKELKSLLKRETPMDRLVYFLGRTKSSGWEIPLSSVNWVLAINRLVQLSETVGVSIRPELFMLGLNLKITERLEFFNGVRSVYKFFTRRPRSTIKPISSSSIIKCSKAME